MKLQHLAIIAALPMVLLACKKDKDPDPTAPPTPAPTSGSVKVEFDFVWGMSAAPFALNQQLTHPMTGDLLTFSEYRFYLSNVKLRRSDGTWWSEPESYRIISAADAAGRTFTVPNVPAGTYTAMAYTLGVDSTRNVSGAQTGALSPSNGMFWSWNSGYIMLKVEGTSPQSPNGGFTFHLGGFQGPNSIVSPRQADLSTTPITVGSSTPTLNFRANAARLWHNTATSVATMHTVHMPGANALNMASGFWDGIVFMGVQ